MHKLLAAAALFASTLCAADKATCDPTIWSHVYHGPEYDTGEDRLTIIQPCITITGKFIHAKAEADGDIHIQMKVDPEFEYLLNIKNLAKPPMGQGGYLVVEPMCSGKVKQADTLHEAVCVGFSQKALFNKKMLNKHVSVTGAYVKDEHHLWLELHPVSRIVLIP